ncbi:hypothetical protein CLU83_1053 [Flavobacterium sp. 1]|nr:hypothetical protein CLU83_1053 [Flavobacterium sp. 1]
MMKMKRLHANYSFATFCFFFFFLFVNAQQKEIRRIVTDVNKNSLSVDSIHIKGMKNDTNSDFLIINFKDNLHIFVIHF